MNSSSRGSCSGLAKKPNFFIVGAPKSGTTALYLYLRQHPEIFLPESVKEPHFFAPQLKHPAFVQNPRDYFALFSSAQSAKRIGEGSVFYLYTKEAPLRIRNFDPCSRIIIMLRNPVDMIYALHNEHFTGGIEKYRRFEDALAAEERRESGAEAVPRTVSPNFFFYRRIGALSAQVQRYLNFFPRDQIHVVFFEDFIRDTAAAFKQTLEFLEVDPAFQPESFPRVNVSRRVRSRTIQRILQARPRFLLRAVRRLCPEKWRQAVKNFSLRLNAPISERPPLDPRTRCKLNRIFEADIRKLSYLLGRDLPQWSDSPPNRPS